MGQFGQRESAPRPSPARESSLRVSSPGDTWEREADRLADAVMNTPQGERASIRATPITTTLQRKCSACEDDERGGLVQREGEGSVSMTSELGSAIHDLRGGGRAMSSSARSFFEPRFGHDFANVRIHADARADQVAQGLRARAFTLGNDIVFRSGQYQPNSAAGQHLLAHELAHVVQQGSGTGSVIQRQADPAATTVTFPSGVPHQSTRVTRTVETRPCTSQNTTQQTPPNQILYWDRQAQAVGFRYTVCHGRVRLATGGSISYDQLLTSATRLLGDVLQNPANLSTAMQNALATASVSGGGQITMTFDGILEATVSASGNAGASAQGVQVRGRILLAPDGNWRFAIEGGYGLNRDALGSTSTYTFRGQIGNRQVTFGVDIRQIDFSPAGGGPTQRDTQIIPSISIPLDPPAQVNCRRCDCPPPQPRFQCETLTEAYDEPIVDRQQAIRTFRLLHLYDTQTPADPTAFQQRLQEIAGLLAADSHVVSIRGFASPEASVAYNRRLGERRANHTRTELQAEIGRQRAAQTPTPTTPAPTLPAIGESGELLGGSSTPGRSEAEDRQLVDEINSQLAGLNDEQRLDLLGVEQHVRDDPARRQAALDDINAFIRGSVNGTTLTRRARWEKIFPHLRRTEVVVDVHKQSHLQHHDAQNGPAGNCSTDQIEEATRLMPPLPARQRLPTDEC